MNAKCLFLYNPSSGRGKVKRRLEKIMRTLRQVYDVEAYATSSAEDLKERVALAASEYDVIVFSGGDGTFRTVLQGLGGRDVQLGYLPSGTANDIARSLGIPRSLSRALNVVVGGKSAQLDCMRINGDEYAMYIAAAGTPTRVTYETPQRSKRIWGWLAYLFRGLRYLDFEVFDVHGTCGGRPFGGEGVLVFVMNGRSVAGFPINRRASMQDGMLEIALLRQKARPNFFEKLGACSALIRLMLFGIDRKRKGIDVIRGNHVRIEAQDNLIWDFDGEEGVRGGIEIELLEKKVKLFVPQGKKV